MKHVVATASRLCDKCVTRVPHLLERLPQLERRAIKTHRLM